MSKILEIPTGYTIIKRNDGIIQKMGKSAGIEANWYYDAVDSNGKDCIIMYCQPGGYTIIDKDIIIKIREIKERKVSWFIMQTGYIAGHILTDEGMKNICLHQYLMNYFGHGQGQDSIDHINRNKLDNRLENLRISTQAEQNENRKKLSRKYNAKPLPDGINHEDLPKYVTYYKEKHGNGTREFFTVEKHPIQKLKEIGIENEKTSQLKNKRWATTKACGVSIYDKLNQAKEYVEFLDNLKNNLNKNINKYQDDNYIFKIKNSTLFI
jgi:hypothetical protein